ncbi:UNVERIFIED_CONTAM: hypothetical protein RMT77_009953 [Armadillidium vulgare]
MPHRPRSSSSHAEETLKKKSQKQLAETTDPIEKLRLMCLARGSGGILGFGKIFRRMDDDGTGTLSEEEFLKGINETGLDATPEEAAEIFKAFDADGKGSIDYNEFIRAIRPRMNENRKKLVEMAFDKLDSTDDGVVNMEDLKGVYSVSRNPHYMSGELSEEDILKRFLRNFEGETTVDGKITKDEFFDYYSGVSASIDKDGFFDLMMRNAWGIK